MTSLKIISYVAVFLAILIVMPAHEFAHAFVAVKCGDDTPKINGRLTLNPMAHFDPLGLIMLLVARFGWAKPVPINPYNFKHLKRGYFFVSIAGVTMNYILAFLFTPIFMGASLLLVRVNTQVVFVKMAIELLLLTLACIVQLNYNLFVFNLIPVYPLDGFRVIEVLSKKENKFLKFLRTKGHFVLLALLLINFLSQYIPLLSYIDLFGWLMSNVTRVIAYPVELFWSWIFGLFIN